MLAAEEVTDNSKEANKDLEVNEKTLLLNGDEHVINNYRRKTEWWIQIMDILHQIGEELRAPPVHAAIIGFIFGAVAWLRNLIIGDNAPFRVIDQ
ncbi:hypothetical protein BUALT_Bualt11G0040100 [Buddleja alternifolia]|uniref:Uncharacterized protein n=1 Tax=Buddleja alternifolia TaxID=168488 RepID=A0AAV6WSE8_9LAMI|nr:hypothetical protein BUALT_Bualt11G0040100 [Buddleja alternifolia]